MPGIRHILLIALACVLATPLMAANEARSSEARANLGILRDRLRVKYIQNGDKLDPNWDVDDLVTRGELDGKYYDGSSYGMFVRSVEERTVCIYALEWFGPQLTMEISDLATGASTITSPGNLPQTPPGYSNAQLERHARLAHEMWWQQFWRELPGAVLTVLPMLVFVLLTPLVIIFRRKPLMHGVAIAACVISIVLFLVQQAQPMVFDSSRITLTAGELGSIGLLLCGGLIILCWNLCWNLLGAAKAGGEQQLGTGGTIIGVVAFGLFVLIMILMRTLS